MKLVPTSVTRGIGKITLSMKKNSPHIFFGAGLVGICGSTFLACRATLKLEPVLDKAQERIHRTKEDYPDDGRALAFAYLAGIKDLGKLYGPSAIVGALSITALTGSHIQLSRRNAVLTTLYTGAVQALEEYRARVREEVGEEKENDLWLGLKEETIVDEDGKKHKVKVADNPDRFSRFFDRSCGNWKPDPDYNRFFLQSQCNFWNQRLNAHGYVFLNDVYEALGYERIAEGQLLGWTLDGGDGYITFGLDDHLNVQSRDALGWSQLLTFNIDSQVMYHKI